MAFLNWMTKNKSNVKEMNPNMSTFAETSSDEIDTIIDKHSTISQATDGMMTHDFASYQNMIYMPVLSNKLDRIRQYRNISRYPEVTWCVEEIADDFAHTDENGSVIKLVIRDTKGATEKRKEILQDEFHKFISLFNFDKDLFQLVKNYVIDGEVAFENIIDPKAPSKGIIAVKYLPTEYYETLLDKKTNRAVGIFFDLAQLKMDQSMLVSQAYSAGQKTFQNLGGSNSSTLNSFMTPGSECIPFIWPQLTYIASNDTNQNETIHYPIVERAKNAYHQLSLLHDAAIILRVTRAPERLLFNISTAGMADKVAKHHVSKFVNDFKAKKTVNSSGEIGQGYNPQTMLEAYFFWKNSESGGTEISSVGGTANYEQMDDINYFLTRLFKAFKVPFSRYKQPENTMERDESITYEEYSFFKQIIRIQKQFARGFKDAFITHLKLRGLWAQYKLATSDIDVIFTTPALYEMYQSSKLLSIKVEAYELLSDREEFSKRLAMKKIFGMSDDEIDNNFKEVEREALEKSVVDYYKNKIEELGPADGKPYIKWKEEVPDDSNM